MEQTQNMTDAVGSMKGHTGALEAMLTPLFAKAPHLPQGGRRFITDVAPWLSLIFGVLGLFGLVSAGAIGFLFAPLLILGGGLHGISFFITIVLGIASSVLSILSFNPLREMKKKGWNYAFYAMIISSIGTIISMVLIYGGLGGIVGILIGAYILFEVREMYK